MREIKFRVWDKKNRILSFVEDLFWASVDEELTHINGGDSEAPLMQFTGLKDKNRKNYIYEGDIIDSEGNIIGNKYENKDLLKGTTNLLIEGLCTKNWKDTEQKACRRGCKYA